MAVEQLPGQTPGTIDPTFNAGTGVSGDVKSLALQPDGKIVIGGNFSTVNGIARSGYARLNTNGTLDTTFLATGSGLSFGWVETILLQADGKVIIGGNFESVDGLARNNIARLNTDGTVDAAFPNTANSFKGADSEVTSMALQPSTGKLLIAGYFGSVNGTARANIARLNSDGSVDTTFTANLGGGVRSMVVQTNGQIIVGGYFSTVDGVGRTNLARLNVNGSLDNTFDAHLTPDVSVVSLALQPDGKLLMGGNFFNVGGVIRYHLARLTTTGNVDQSFNIPNPIYDSNYPEVNAIVVQPSGLIVIGGTFEYVNAEVHTNLCRLNPDGSTDASFSPAAGTDPSVHALALQPDNKVVLSGSFSICAGVSRPGIARIYAPTQAIPICNPIPLPVGRTVAQLSNATPVTVFPPNGALWDSVQQALYPATNGTIVVTWNFTNAPNQVTQVLTIEGFPVLTYDLGQEVPMPACAATDLDHIAGAGAFWHKFKRKMYVTAPGLQNILWTRPNGPSFTFPQQVVGQWPADANRYQLHVANTPVVQVAGSNQFAFGSLQAQEGGASLSSLQFSATSAGRSLLLLAPGPNPDATNIYFQFVKTIVYNDPAYFRDTNVAIIGDVISDPAHDPSCGSPYVFDYLTPNYPWRCSIMSNFYNRSARTGPVIPVNRSASGTRADDLLLILYQKGARLQDPLSGTLIPSTVAWPYQPSRYLSVWPSNADKIFIAGGQGSGPVQLPNRNWQVYRQPQTNAYGYNPNEEHAIRLGAPPPLLKLNVNATAVSMVAGDSVPLTVSITGDPAFAPQGPIFVAVSGSRDGDTNIAVLFPTNAVDQQLVFWPTNWLTPQTVTVAAGTNSAAGNSVLTFRASGALASSVDVTAFKLDPGQPAIVADILQFEIVEGASRAVKLRLSKAPATIVTLVTTNRGTLSDSARLKVQSGGALTFAPTNWFIPQTLTLQAESDNDAGADTAVFNITASGGLSAFLSLNVTQTDTTPVDDAVYALRNDLGDAYDTTTPITSEPYVLLAYTNNLGEGRMKVYKVLAEDATHKFESNLKAGRLIQRPYPLQGLPECLNTVAVSGPYFLDRNHAYWARAAAIVNGLPAPTNIVLQYFYHPQPTASAAGFDPPRGVAAYTGSECLPWLDYYAGTVGTPINYNFVITWPDSVPELRVGETLVKPKFGLPNIANQCSVDVIYEQTGPGTLVQLYDPLAKSLLPVSNLPGNRLPSAIVTQVDPADQKLVFMEVPISLRKRIKFNPNTVPPQFEFGGYYNDTDYVGEPLFLPNVMTIAEANVLKSLSSDTAYRNAIDQLRVLTLSAVTGVSSVGSQFKALTASFAQGQGYVTLAMQNSGNCNPLPISLEIIKVMCPLYRGDIKAIYADCAFDETLTLRHSADFAGRGDAYEYEWFYRKAGDLAWIQDPTQKGQDLTIRGAGLRTLEDYEYYCHYRPIEAGVCGASWSADTIPALAEGWIKRVMRGVNPFTQINTDFHSAGVNSTANMIQQAGARWQGNIALNCLPGNNFGLIEAYETVFRRGIDLSIGSGFPLVDDTALRLAAGQLCDLYMLLGNEAYGDAQDPTIGFGTEGGQFTATSIHCFEGQQTSLLGEELALLRGRDGPYGTDSSGGTRVDIAPVYNRLYWNFGPDQAGQTAYVLNYNIADQNSSGTIDSTDARLMFPQGHGDAWGHYLTAIRSFYRLFSNPNYTWVPQVEQVNVNGANVAVNYQYERKFAKAAAARARTGAEILNLTYRSLYVEDPAGQWQGYRDANTNRAWGVSEWGSRAGQSALFDWVAGNALLPAVDNVSPPVAKVDRTTVAEFREVAASFQDVQQVMDNADRGLNPLGLDKDVVPFGLEPAALTSGQTHFEQVYGRAIGALNNAIAVFNHANEPTQLLRKQQDTLVDFQRNVTERLNDFTNRLIEIFGYPYNEDIGGAGAYPVGYIGPDLYHFNYVDIRQLAGVDPPTTQTLTCSLREIAVNPDGSLSTVTRPVVFNLSSERKQLVKPGNFTARQAPGELQRALGDLTQARVRLEQGLASYDQLIAQIEDQSKLIAAQHLINGAEISVLNVAANTQRTINDLIAEARNNELRMRSGARVATFTADAMAEFLPTAVGLATDATAPMRGAIRLAGAILAENLNQSADDYSAEEMAHQQAKEDAQNASNIELTTIRQEQALLGQVAQLQQLVRQQAVQRYELYNLREAVTQASENYLAILARGYRLVEDRVRFLQETAAQVQAYRYKDMAFRIFRNDALQKYRSQFDLAARYVYLAAKAYDYETGLLQGSSKSGAAFLEDIVKKRAIGTIQNGVPLPGNTGDSGLASPMAAMNQNYATIKANLGINNQITRQRLFSLRNGWFRIGNAATNGPIWRDTLQRLIVNNIWDIPEFQRYCRPLRAEPGNGHEPAIVITFPSTILAEQNFFGWPAGGGDSAYNASLFSTKILSVGIWLSSYDSTANGLVQYPSAWLVPIGQDVVRAAGANDFSYRQWKVFDQKIPVPNNFLSTPPNYSANWIPINFSLNGEFGAVGGQRQYNSIDATTESQSIPLDTTHIQTDSGLIGRSVWNTQWMLIIPGVALLGSDPDEGLQRFIAGALLSGQRTGNGVTDIKVYFQTYSYSGF